MNQHRRARRSFLSGGLSTLAGVWVFGAESVAALIGAVSSSGCDPRAKYGGPPPDLFLDASSSSSATLAPSSSEPRPDASVDPGDAELPSPTTADGSSSAVPSSVPATTTPPAPTAGPKYGGRPKYGGPPPQPRKYGGVSSNENEF